MTSLNNNFAYLSTLKHNYAVSEQGRNEGRKEKTRINSKPKTTKKIITINVKRKGGKKGRLSYTLKLQNTRKNRNYEYKTQYIRTREEIRADSLI